MFALFANGAPPPYPRPDAPALEWAVWGGCVGAAALLAGWAILNRNHPARDRRVGVALLCAVALGGFATVFVMQREWDREKERSSRQWRERSEQLDRETHERARE